MRRSRLALLFLLGAWTAGTLFMWQVAIQNFAVAERVAASGDEGLRLVTGDLSDEGLREALRFQASEVNRLFFTGWGWVQFPLAGAVLLLAWRSQTGLAPAVLAGIMLALVVLMTVFLVPESVRLGRLIDFAADGDLVETRDTFWVLHHTYTGFDMLKIALGLAGAGLVFRRSRPAATRI